MVHIPLLRQVAAGHPSRRVARAGTRAKFVAPRLIGWFRAHRRALPWRRNRDPYRVWVAEVILQQTRVEQAIPRFESFVTRFPDMATLASARREAVLREWAGAGYYSRAHRLHDAARIIVRDHGGKLPSTASELRALPGFGPYIASAVASMAFGEPIVAVESNGIRVAARLTKERGDVARARVRRRLTAWLERQLPSESPGAFNEALMELGEVVCRPRRPRCLVCPLAGSCVAYRDLDDPSSLPAGRPRSRRPHFVAAVVVLEAGGRWLVQRRPPTGLLAGLWEFPGGKLKRGELPETAARRELAEETGQRVETLRALGTVRHGYSHFSVDLHAFWGVADPTRARIKSTAHQRWVTPKELADLAKPKATERVIELLAKFDRSGIRVPSRTGSVDS